MSKPAQPPYLSNVPLTWLRRAQEVGGEHGLCLALVIWRECRLGHTRRKHGRGTLPGFVKLPYARAAALFDLSRRTFGRKILQLEEAGLIVIRRTGGNAAYQVRVVALPGEEHWTAVWLGLPPPPEQFGLKFSPDDEDD
jgi:DNA-binding transcriptional ArsR family regulator